jgi:hypothetical protein
MVNIPVNDCAIFQQYKQRDEFKASSRTKYCAGAAPFFRI